MYLTLKWMAKIEKVALVPLFWYLPWIVPLSINCRKDALFFVNICCVWLKLAFLMLSNLHYHIEAEICRFYWQFFGRKNRKIFQAQFYHNKNTIFEYTINAVHKHRYFKQHMDVLLTFIDFICSQSSKSGISATISISNSRKCNIETRNR